MVLLHGLTDSPYGLPHIARRYRDLGFVAVAIRLPGHGTVQAGLSDVQWEAWSEATRLGVREARRKAPLGPLHLIGFSNGSERVLFDVNRSVRFGPLLRARADTALGRLPPEPPRNFRTAVITNISSTSGEVLVRTVEAGSTTEQTRVLGLAYPDDVFSLSHVAVPFPVSDSLYGSNRKTTRPSA